LNRSEGLDRNLGGPFIERLLLDEWDAGCWKGASRGRVAGFEAPHSCPKCKGMNGPPAVIPMFEQHGKYELYALVASPRPHAATQSTDMFEGVVV